MKSKILIIEDNRDVRENLSEILTLSGYETFTASNGKEGVQAALSQTPDLILCDIMMPELDGYGVLRILSKNETISNVPFIFLSAKTEMGDVRRGMTLGADDYITKPFDDVELLDTIEVRLQKRKNSGGPSGTIHSIINLPSGEHVIGALPDALKEGEPRMIRKKDLLFSEGQTCRNVFIIQSGRAIATKIDDYSKEVVTRLYQAPMIIGVSSAFTGQRYQETVKAFEDLEVIPVKKDDFLKYVLHEPSSAFYFLQQMASYQVKADEKLLLQAFGSVRMKLAATLIDLYSSYEEEGKAVIPVSREDLASMAGTAKETIIRCLSEFKEEGLVTIHGSDIVVTSVQKLAELRY
jgi:CRP/FNR family transcriptional regulator, polysaccharide utilization system transcription regulator